MREYNGLYFRVSINDSMGKLEPRFFCDVFDARLHIRDNLGVEFFDTSDHTTFNNFDKDAVIQCGDRTYRPILASKFQVKTKSNATAILDTYGYAQSFTAGRAFSVAVNHEKPTLNYRGAAPIAETQRYDSGNGINLRRIHGKEQLPDVEQLRGGKIPHPRIGMLERLALPFNVHPRQIVLNAPPTWVLGMPENARPTYVPDPLTVKVSA